MSFVASRIFKSCRAFLAPVAASKPPFPINSQQLQQPALFGVSAGLNPRSIDFTQWRSVSRIPFVDAFLLKMKKNTKRLNNRKIWSRRSTILPEFVNTTVRIYNGKTFIRCKINEGKVGHKFGEFALTRKRRKLLPANAGPGKKKAKGKRARQM
uniref:Ribosomal protein S19 n=3 Tax=Rhizophora mucronata TaxID=61149 RepID=A0A2P2JXC6_RHIMU